MEKKKKPSLEERIEQFCSSSGELLAGINAKYGSEDRRKRKRKKKNIVSVPETDPDFFEDELFEGRL